MSIKVTVAVLSSVALGAVGIGGGFLYDRLTKSKEDSDSSQEPSEASGGVDKSPNHQERGKRQRKTKEDKGARREGKEKTKQRNLRRMRA